MEKRIEEKFNGPLRLIVSGYSVPMVALLLHAVVTRRIKALGVMLVVYIILYLVVRIILRISGRQKSTWFLTEDGLKCVHADGEQDAIPWGQIKSLKYMKYVGLFMRWDKTKTTRKGEVSYGEVSSILSVDKDEAQELFSLWHRTMPLHPDKVVRSRKAANRFEAQQGGKSLFAGCLGLYVAILELSSKRWLIGMLLGLISVTALTLGIGALKGTFRGKKGSLIEKILVILLGVWLVCILVAVMRGYSR
jgi:hypothetical protein